MSVITKNCQDNREDYNNYICNKTHQTRTLTVPSPIILRLTTEWRMNSTKSNKIGSFLFLFKLSVETSQWRQIAQQRCQPHYNASTVEMQPHALDFSLVVIIIFLNLDMTFKRFSHIVLSLGLPSFFFFSPFSGCHLNSDENTWKLTIDDGTDFTFG